MHLPFLSHCQTLQNLNFYFWCDLESILQGDGGFSFLNITKFSSQQMTQSMSNMFHLNISFVKTDVSKAFNFF